MTSNSRISEYLSEILIPTAIRLINKPKKSLDYGY